MALNGHLAGGVLYIQDIGHEPCILDEGLARGKKLKIFFA